MKLIPSLKRDALRRKKGSISCGAFHSLEQGDFQTNDLKANQVMHRYWRLKWMHWNKTWSVFLFSTLVAGLIQMFLFLLVTKKKDPSSRGSLKKGSRKHDTRKLDVMICF